VANTWSSGGFQGRDDEVYAGESLSLQRIDVWTHNPPIIDSGLPSAESAAYRPEKSRSAGRSSRSGRVWQMSVKPSHSPTQVRTLGLPPPAKRSASCGCAARRAVLRTGTGVGRRGKAGALIAGTAVRESMTVAGRPARAQVTRVRRRGARHPAPARGWLRSSHRGGVAAAQHIRSGLQRSSRMLQALESTDGLRSLAFRE
jgi:hypothetical protein